MRRPRGFWRHPDTVARLKAAFAQGGRQAAFAAYPEDSVDTVTRTLLVLGLQGWRKPRLPIAPAKRKTTTRKVAVFPQRPARERPRVDTRPIYLRDLEIWDRS